MEINNENLIIENTSFFRDVTKQPENNKGNSSKYEFYSSALIKTDSFNYVMNSGGTSEALMNTLTNVNKSNPMKPKISLQRKPS